MVEWVTGDRWNAIWISLVNVVINWIFFRWPWIIHGAWQKCLLTCKWVVTNNFDCQCNFGSGGWRREEKCETWRQFDWKTFVHVAPIFWIFFGSQLGGKACGRLNDFFFLFSWKLAILFCCARQFFFRYHFGPLPIFFLLENKKYRHFATKCLTVRALSKKISLIACSKKC